MSDIVYTHKGKGFAYGSRKASKSGNKVEVRKTKPVEKAVEPEQVDAETPVADVADKQDYSSRSKSRFSFNSKE